MYGISGAFVAALQSPGHIFRIRMDVLDTNLNIVAQFHDIGGGVAPEDILVDGNVDIDVTRLTRRTFTASVLNPNGVWSPGSDWGGTFYVNRVVRFWRGIDYGSGEELVPIGTFLIDAADVQVERSMSIVSLSGSDFWKKFNKSAFSGAKSWPAGTSINTIALWIATDASITAVNIDPLGSRVTGDTQIGGVFAVERGDNRGEALAKLCADNGIDIYFSPLGVLTTQDFLTPGDQASVYTYDPDQNNNLITVKASFTDDNLYNAVLVVGSGNKDSIVTYRIRDTDPLSVTSIYRLGERTMVYQSDTISSVTVAQSTAERLFYANVLVNEDITLEVICNPAYEGNDVITVRETDFSGLDGQFRIKALTVPMATSRQSIRLLREVKLT